MCTVIQTTLGKEADARAMGMHLVEQRLAACIHLHPVQSIFRWQNTIETDEEWVLQAKTQDARVDEVCATIRKLHSYDLPEITVTRLDAASPEYKQWIQVETERR